ncbi:MAG: ABC transporter ATP-binding protein, partial [Clostridia bacterium]|nr:ABC transporter ATP-binding protein [Clostridia bacterium]
MLSIENVSVRYGAKTAVENVSFRLRAGGWLMLCGPNGAGKSTLVRAIAQGVPYAGRVLLEGQDARAIRPAAFARAVGVLPQHNSVGFAFTVEEIVRMGRYAHRKGLFSASREGDEEAVNQALADTGLEEFRTQNVMTLSGGELQRVFLAQVLAQQPRILVLDEPANHLDLKYQQQVFGLVGEWLARPGHAALTVVHDLTLARRYGT